MSTSLLYESQTIQVSGIANQNDSAMEELCEDLITDLRVGIYELQERIQEKYPMFLVDTIRGK